MLLGYAYAHGLRRLGRPQLHWLLAPLILIGIWLLPGLPLAASAESGGVHAIGQLLLWFGLPVFLLTTTSPLLQAVYAHKTGKPPFHLYALSNIGSLVGLLAYPFVVEPLLPLSWQYVAGLGLFFLYVGLLYLGVWRNSQGLPRAAGQDQLFTGNSAVWLVLATVPAALLASTSNQLTQDVAATPLLWVVPLALYLGAFWLAFARPAFARQRWLQLLAAALVMATVAGQAMGPNLHFLLKVSIYVAALTVCSLVCLGELAGRAPEDSEQVTGYYLVLAAGGVLGTALVTFAAPFLFGTYDEFPLALAASLALPVILHWQTAKATPLAYATPALAIFACLYQLSELHSQPDVLRRMRSFHGMIELRAGQSDLGKYRRLVHGTIDHGLQFFDAEKAMWPTSYYGRGSGVGMVLEKAQTPTQRVGIIGLGVGTLAVYGRENDQYRFYEINPDVVTMATSDFSYLKRSAPSVDVVVGDGRFTLAKETKPFDVLVIDAFSGDAIPTHLLTKEAGDLYRKALQPNGALLFHISNRAVDLTPVVRALGQHLGLTVRRLVSFREETKTEFGATWMLLTNNSTWLNDPDLQRLTRPFTAQERQPLLWTDDYSSLLSVLR